MSSSKLKKFCRIVPWIEKNDAKFADALSALCLEGQLTARPGSSGITFLYPTDKVRKAFIASAFSDDPEQAILLLEAHIIPTYIKSISDFSNKTGSKARVLIGWDSSTQKLASGAKFKVAPDFKALGKRGKGGISTENKIAVWLVEGGEVPTTGEAFDPRSVTKTGGGLDNAKSDRYAIMKTIESKFIASVKNGSDKCFDGLLGPLLGLMATLAKPEFKEDYEKALCVLDRNPTCLYLLVEPNRTGDHYISDNAISTWGGASGEGASVSILLNMFNTQLTSDNVHDSNMIDSYDTVIMEKNRSRTNLLSNVSVQTPSKVNEYYQKITSSNRIGNCDKVWPTNVASAFENGRKLWQDTVRYHLRIAQRELCNGPADSFEDSFINIVHDLFPGKDYLSEIKGYYGIGEKKASKDAATYDMLGFINSTDFLYTPGPLTGGNENNNPDTNPMYRGPWDGQTTTTSLLQRSPEKELINLNSIR